MIEETSAADAERRARDVRVRVAIGLVVVLLYGLVHLAGGTAFRKVQPALLAILAASCFALLTTRLPARIQKQVHRGVLTLWLLLTAALLWVVTSPESFAAMLRFLRLR